MNKVTENVRTGVSINSDELQSYKNFLWEFFDSIPRLKKHYYGDNVSQAMME